MNPCYWADNPTHFECTRCNQRKVPRSDIEVLPYRRTCGVQKSRGLGDTIARWFKRFGVKSEPGCGCAGRQKKINSLIPYNKIVWKYRLFWPVIWIWRIISKK